MAKKDAAYALYLWDGWESVAVLNQSGVAQEIFTRGVGIAGDIGTLVAVTKPATPAIYYAHYNHRGDVALTRNNTATVGTYGYSAYGSLIAQTGTDVSRFKFSSKEREPSCGWSYYGFRFYAPSWQRWPNRDPIRGGMASTFTAANPPPWGSSLSLGRQMQRSASELPSKCAPKLGVGFQCWSYGGSWRRLLLGRTVGRQRGRVCKRRRVCKKSPSGIAQSARLLPTPWAVGALCGYQQAFLTNAKKCRELNGPLEQWNLNTVAASLWLVERDVDIVGCRRSWRCWRHQRISDNHGHVSDTLTKTVTMNGLIAVAAFLVLVYLFARWFRLLIIRYHLTENSIRITVFGLPIFRIPYRRIQSCDLG